MKISINIKQLQSISNVVDDLGNLDEEMLSEEMLKNLVVLKKIVSSNIDSLCSFNES